MFTKKRIDFQDFTQKELIPSEKFAGVRDGFFYTHGNKGLGYYSYSIYHTN